MADTRGAWNTPAQLLEQLDQLLFEIAGDQYQDETRNFLKNAIRPFLESQAEDWAMPGMEQRAELDRQRRLLKTVVDSFHSIAVATNTQNMPQTTFDDQVTVLKRVADRIPEWVAKERSWAKREAARTDGDVSSWVDICENLEGRLNRLRRVLQEIGASANQAVINDLEEIKAENARIKAEAAKTKKEN